MGAEGVNTQKELNPLANAERQGAALVDDIAGWRAIPPKM